MRTAITVAPWLASQGVSLVKNVLTEKAMGKSASNENEVSLQSKTYPANYCACNLQELFLAKYVSKIVIIDRLDWILDMSNSYGLLLGIGSRLYQRCIAIEMNHRLSS
jgi:hypothetical protein